MCIKHWESKHAGNFFSLQIIKKAFYYLKTIIKFDDSKAVLEKYGTLSADAKSKSSKILGSIYIGPPR